MNATFLSEKFSAALPYHRYVLTGTEEQQRRWKQVYDLARLTEDQSRLVAGFVREMRVLVVSGIWCGDCVQQCPLLERIAEANPQRVKLCFVDRDLHRDLAEQLRINAGDRVPRRRVRCRGLRVLQRPGRPHARAIPRLGPLPTRRKLPRRHRPP